jgi:hypothetical protein
MRSSLLLVLALIACSPPAEDPVPEVPWEPGVSLSSAEGPNERGLLDRRGLIHAHTAWSHDACDGEPGEGLARNQACMDDFRQGLCSTRHDYVMLTDHGNAFSIAPFEEALLFRADAGDELVERGGAPVASWLACDDGTRALVLAGTETGLMPVGLEGHARPEGERGAAYGPKTPAAAALLREAGAVVLLAHTEAYSGEELLALDVDGFEMFNLHAALLRQPDVLLDLAIRIGQRDPGMPHPDLVALPIFEEDPRDLEAWGQVLAAGARRVSTLGTDCHQNVFPGLLEDDERIDSFRRMMSWFSNHLLVRPEPSGAWDDRHLKAALKEGRLYGSFDLLGAPQGFAFTLEAGGEVVEMGGEASASSSPTLVVRRPRVRGLDAAAEPPALSVRLLRAHARGFEEVAAADDEELRFVVSEPGAYRAEVRMVPFHLRPWLNDDELRVLRRDFVWVMSNPIYVR